MTRVEFALPADASVIEMPGFFVFEGIALPSVNRDSSAIVRATIVNRRLTR
jgi:hypothetical protein